MSGESDVRRFLKDLTPSEHSKLFTELHEQIRNLMLNFARTHGYAFSANDLENVLWEYGLGHDQLEIHSKSKDEAEKKIKERFEHEEADGKKRTDAEKDKIKNLDRENVGKWRRDPDKKVDEHTAWVIVHSAAN